MKKPSIIILAGGDGTRFNDRKQFVLLENKPLWEWAYDAASIYSNDISIVGIDVPPGATRSESVINGLNSISLDHDHVIILEAARPLVTSNHIEKLLATTSQSVSFSVPMVETILLKSNHTNPYINRTECVSFQTPQMFDSKLLLNAYTLEENPDYTDETIVMHKHYDIYPDLIEGDERLMKITYPHDLETIRHILNANRGDYV